MKRNIRFMLLNSILGRSILAVLIIFLPGRAEAREVDAVEVERQSSDKSMEVRLEVYPMRKELRVYIGADLYKSYPVAVGKPETPTPTGSYQVIHKDKDWGKGFGTRWMELDAPWGIYGIHGTNKPSFIGTRDSQGCIRLLNEDVEELFELVQVGSRVEIFGHVLGDMDQDPRELVEGNAGGDVELVQNRLRSAGYYAGPCDGKFTVETEQALRLFELSHLIPVDGTVGMDDYRELGLSE